MERREIAGDRENDIALTIKYHVYKIYSSVAVVHANYESTTNSRSSSINLLFVQHITQTKCQECFIYLLVLSGLK